MFKQTHIVLIIQAVLVFYHSCKVNRHILNASKNVRIVLPWQTRLHRQTNIVQLANRCLFTYISYTQTPRTIPSKTHQ